ncbi:MAG TPA: zf-HC2 domain-containing protein [Gemmatimonadaceae bacterium]
MNKCINSDIQEMLPDLLHGTLADDARKRVEAHVATCESCQEDLDVLRTVKSAAIFAPSIDVDGVVRQIPPYRTIVPAIERPASTRVVSWLVAASLVLVVLGGGSVLMIQSKGSQASNSTSYSQVQKPVAAGSEATKLSPQESVVVPKTVVPVVAPNPHALALAADADGLSDGSLVQLMNDMDGFDALPGSEPDPVISVDSGDSL